jgi:hypothetical protein
MVSGQLYIPTTLPCRKPPSTHFIGGCMGLRGGLDILEKEMSCPCQESNFDSSVIQHVAKSLY